MLSELSRYPRISVIQVIHGVGCKGGGGVKFSRPFTKQESYDVGRSGRKLDNTIYHNVSLRAPLRRAVRGFPAEAAKLPVFLPENAP